MAGTCQRPKGGKESTVHRQRKHCISTPGALAGSASTSRPPFFCHHQSVHHGSLLVIISVHLRPSPSPCLLNRAGFSQHQSTSAANKSDQSSPCVLYLLRFVRCHRRRASRDGGGRGAGGGTTIGKRRQWWWLKWKPGWIEKVRWCSRTSTASAVVVARMHAVDAVVRNAYVCTVPGPRSRTKRETTEQPET